MSHSLRQALATACLLGGWQASAISTSFAAVLAIVAWGVAPRAQAVVVAIDEASNAAYAPDPGGAWNGTDPTLEENEPGIDNGGYGFLPWDFSGGFHDPMFSPYGRRNHFIDGIDFSPSQFNDLGGPAFGLTNSNQAYFGYTVRATRVLDRPLVAGSSVAIQFDNPILQPLAISDESGFIVRLNGGGGPRSDAHPNVSERLGFFATSGFHQDAWHVTDAAGITDTNLDSAMTSSGAQWIVDILEDDAYALKVMSLDGSTTLLSWQGQLTGSAELAIDTIEILLYGNGSGNGEVGVAALPTGEREFFFNHLVVTEPDPALPGDYNGDGIVDAADYATWRDHLGAPPRTLLNDADGGPIGPAQYATWKANFGATLPPVDLLENTTVPEPGTAVLLALSELFLLARRSRSMIGRIAIQTNTHSI